VEAFSHRPVLLREVIEALRPRAGGRYADATVGGGGHAEAVLQASDPDGYLYGCDRDEAAVAAATARLSRFAGRVEIRRLNFAELGGWLAPGSCDGVLFDLGLSSPQLDRPERGFSFQQEGPLDMRMDQRQALTAADLVNTLPEAELARLFWELGDEPQARRLARAIVLERQTRRFDTTTHLARFIEQRTPRGGKQKHPATRVFLALRCRVNSELEALPSALAAACTLLKPGGRLAVITFHSAEDRLVKEFGRRESLDYETPGDLDIPELRKPRAPRLKWVSRKAICPSAEEAAGNPRARSAQLRVLERR
jgi:16S rRNA (cytosine1402-N4)-methyltransferase